MEYKMKNGAQTNLLLHGGDPSNLLIIKPESAS
jgi:hypothetical protein